MATPKTDMKTQYKTTDRIPLWADPTKIGVVATSGYLAANQIITFKASKAVTGGVTMYQIARGANYQKSDGTYASVINMWTGAVSFIAEVADTSGGYAGLSITLNCKDGTTETLSPINALRSPTRVYIKAGHTQYVYKGPNAGKYARAYTAQAGTYIDVYATYTQSNGVLWAATNQSMTNWCTYKSGGNLVSSLSYSSDTGKAAATTETSTTETATTSGGGTRMDQSTVSTTPSVPAANVTSAVTTSEGVATDANGEVYADIMAMNDSIANSGSASFGNTAVRQALSNMMNVIGIPPKITKAADPQYMLSSYPSNNFGRCYTDLFMISNTIASLQPCKVKYLPGYSTDEQNAFFEIVGGLAGGALDKDDVSGLQGQLFQALPDYNDYINTVNLLARTMAIYLGVGDKHYLGYSSAPLYRNMDYSWYKIAKFTDANKVERSNNFIGAIGKQLRSAWDGMFTSVINDDTYLHFYGTADGTSLSESMSVSTKSSAMESLFNNSLSEIAQDIQFLTSGESGIDFQSALGSAMDGAMDMVGGAVSGVSATLGSIIKQGANYLDGGRMVFPQMLDDCQFGRSFTFTCRFISPSGDPEARFINCYLPLAYLYPYVLPQMMKGSENMYRYPFLCRSNVSGLWHSDLSAITAMRLQRGGPDGDAFTVDGLPFEIDVSFDITPLTSKLMVTNARHPLMYLRNTALQEYLGALCGISFTGDEMKLKLNIIHSLFGNEITDTVPSILRGYYSSDLANTLRRAFTMTN